MGKVRKLIGVVCDAVLNRIFCVFSINKNKVLFLSDARGTLSGNLKSVYDALSDCYEKEVFLKADRRMHRSLREYLSLIFHLATSKVVFLDDFASETAYMHVREGQSLVQLWHGSGAFKKFGYSRAKETGGDLKHVHSGYKRYTLALTSSEAIRSCYADAFSLPLERVQALGIPRTDVFFESGREKLAKEALIKNYPFLRGKKILLFAPTYRGDRVENASYDFSKLDFIKLRRELGDEWGVILKWHPALYENMRAGKVVGPDLTGLSDYVVDLSNHREVNDLLFSADVLVTDYSSVIFDYALLHKPIVYFAYDLAQYADGRGLFFPFDTYVYGRVSSDMQSLIEAVRAEDLCDERRLAFEERFISANDGCAVRRLLATLSLEIKS